MPAQSPTSRVDARRRQPLLGTFAEIGVAMRAEAWDGKTAVVRPGDGPAAGTRADHAHAAITAAFAVIATIERLLSFHDPASELSRLNRDARQGVTLHPLAARVLRLALVIGHASDDRFNCTVGGALVRRGLLPDHGGSTFIDCGSWRDLELHGRHARLLRPVRVTLDGIAKGYAVDLAVRVLRRHGAVAGWVNAGGDLRAFGDLALPVQGRNANGTPAALGELRDAAMATSRAGLPPDPRMPGFVTGARAPATGTWTVLARRAWLADALTKVAAFCGDDERAAVVARLGGILVAPELPEPR